MKLTIDLDMTNTGGTVGVALMSMLVILVSQSSRIGNIVFKSKKPILDFMAREGDSDSDSDSVSDISDIGKIYDKNYKQLYSDNEDYEKECLIEDDSVVKQELVSCLDFIKEQKPEKLYDYVKKCENTVAIHGTTKKDRHWVYSNLGNKIYAKSIKEGDGKRVLLLTDIILFEGLGSKPSEIVSYDVDNDKSCIC